MYIRSSLKTPTERFIGKSAKLFDSLKIQLLESITNTASRKVNGSKPGGFRKASRKVFLILVTSWFTPPPLRHPGF